MTNNCILELEACLKHRPKLKNFFLLKMFKKAQFLVEHTNDKRFRILNGFKSLNFTTVCDKFYRMCIFTSLNVFFSTRQKNISLSKFCIPRRVSMP